MMLQPLLKKTETERLFKMLFSEEKFPSSSLEDAVSNDWKKFWIILIVDFVSFLLIFERCWPKDSSFWQISMGLAFSYWFARFFTGQAHENIIAIKTELMKNTYFTNLATSLQSDKGKGKIIFDSSIRKDYRYIHATELIREFLRNPSYEETPYPHPINEP